MPPEDCQSLFDKAGEPKKMVTYRVSGITKSTCRPLSTMS